MQEEGARVFRGFRVRGFRVLALAYTARAHAERGEPSLFRGSR